MHPRCRGGPGQRSDAGRVRVSDRRCGAGRCRHATHAGDLPDQSEQPDRRDVHARGTRGRRGRGPRARPLGRVGRGLWRAHLRAAAPRHRGAAWDGGADRDGRQPVEVARHDGLARRLDRRPARARGPRGEPRDLHALRPAGLRPGGGAGGDRLRRDRHGADARHLPASARLDGRAAGGRAGPALSAAGSRHVHARRRPRHRPFGARLLLGTVSSGGCVGARRLGLRGVRRRLRPAVLHGRGRGVDRGLSADRAVREGLRPFQGGGRVAGTRFAPHSP